MKSPSTKKINSEKNASSLVLVYTLKKKNLDLKKSLPRVITPFSER